MPDTMPSASPESRPPSFPLNNPRSGPPLSLPPMRQTERTRGFGVRESVRERGGRGGRSDSPLSVCQWLKYCPRCGHEQAEVYDAYAPPAYIVCAPCDRIIPTAAWGTLDCTNITRNAAAWRDLGYPDRGR